MATDQSDAEKAYDTAQQMIANAIADDARLLTFKTEETAALTELPPEIGNARNLRRLSLSGTKVSDLSPIRALVNLDALTISGTQVATLDDIADIIELKELEFRNTAISDLEPISGLKKLKRFHADSSRLIDLSPIRDCTDLITINVSRTSVHDAAPLENMTKLTGIYFNDTDVIDIAPLWNSKKLTYFHMRRSKVADIGVVANFNNLINFSIDDTDVEDLRPALLLPNLGSDGDLSGYSFKGCRATQIDPEIDRISKIKDNQDRMGALRTYLQGWTPPGARVDQASDTPPPLPPVPARRPAPLEVEVTDQRLAMAALDDLPQSDMRSRAEMGWQAIKDLREDFEAAFNLSNYAPLPAYLAAFDRAMGDAYDASRVIRIGTQAQRFVALAQDDNFTASLPDGAAQDMRTFATSVIVYVQRFPDWVAYVGDTEPLETIDAADIAELKKIARQMRGDKRVDADVTNEYDSEVSQAAGPQATDVEGKAVMSSTGEIGRAVAEATNKKRREQALRRDLAKSGGDFLEGAVRGPMGLPDHLALRFRDPLTKLAVKYPNRLGWITTWYDETYGPEDNDFEAENPDGDGPTT